MARALSIYSVADSLPLGVTREQVGLSPEQHAQVLVAVAAPTRAAAVRAMRAHGGGMVSDAFVRDYGNVHPVREDHDIDVLAAAEPGRVFVERLNARTGDPVVPVPTNDEREAGR